MTGTWDGPALTLVIASFFGGLVTVVGAVFAGIAMLRAGKAVVASETAKEKASETGAAIAVVKVQTDGALTRLTEQNKMLVDEIKALKVEQFATQNAALQLALARVQALEQEVIKRADATVPPGAEPPTQTADLAAINDTLEHERRNRKAASAGIQAAIEDLNQRLLFLQGATPAPLIEDPP
jgi:hypothetical protein